MEVRRGRTAVYSLHAHRVFATKAAQLNRVETIFAIMRGARTELRELDVKRDHVRLAPRRRRCASPNL
jgi:hypothetical protein